MSPQSSPHRPGRRRRDDLESASPYTRSSPPHDSSSQSRHHSHRRQNSASNAPSSPAHYYDESHHLMASSPAGEGLVRKKSLVRHDRRQPDPNSRGYHYRKHAQNMNVHPSTTGEDPSLEDEMHTISSSSTDVKSLTPHPNPPDPPPSYP